MFILWVSIILEVKKQKLKKPLNIVKRSFDFLGPWGGYENNSGESLWLTLALDRSMWFFRAAPKDDTAHLPLKGCFYSTSSFYVFLSPHLVDAFFLYFLLSVSNLLLFVLSFSSPM